MEDDYVVQKRMQQREYAKQLEAQMEEHHRKYRRGRNAGQSPLKLPQLAIVPGGTTPLTTPTKAATSTSSPNRLVSFRSDDAQPETSDSGDLRTVVRQLQTDFAQHVHLVHQLTTTVNEVNRMIESVRVLIYMDTRIILFQKHNAVVQRLLDLIQSPMMPSSATIATTMDIPSTLLAVPTLAQHATRLDALEKAVVVATSNALLREDFDAMATVLIENKSQVLAHVTALGERVRAVEATIATQCPTWSHVQEMHAKVTDAMAQLRVDVERTMVVKLREVLDHRDQLQAETHASHSVLSQLSSNVDIRRQEATGVRVAALEASLDEHRARMDLEVAVQNKMEQVVTATEAAMLKVDTWQRVEQARWGQWTAQHLAANEAQWSYAQSKWTDWHDQLSRRMEEVATASAEQRTQVQQHLANMDKVVAAEIRKRASDIAAVQAAGVDTCERLVRQWKRESQEQLRPLMAQVSTLETRTAAAQDEARQYRDTEQRLRDDVHVFTLKHQDAIAIVRVDAECQGRALACEMKALQRDAEGMARRLVALETERQVRRQNDGT
ncbi:hypothetical protein, variant 1 [Aphanomyces astaci]|uniref:Uncharacterized protein n=1 Tax=Aphanomyces astaci TaxID=112090 RepID=W4G6L9_APHAT|nr:hypothetical protein, variant 1 [Aphanomyces astaci]ETV74699.1 hypothetical protein, variant 1 [Aphanomyces astaci]|eukprot:XP_009835786.1 hypothetical protein, variant 1 [Aphanomyces astaci]